MHGFTAAVNASRQKQWVSDQPIPESNHSPKRLAVSGLALLMLAFAAPAFAQAPVAVNDNQGTGLAAITEGGSITGSYNVLANDTPGVPPAMTAALLGGTANGTIQLFSDGTFNYVHNGTETSSDSFTYQANNGTPSNTATVTISIINTNDTPVLTLNGPAVVNLFTGNTYNEQGASATDEEDNDVPLTNRIVIGGDTVNTAVPGTYTVTYNVTDSDGAPAAQITRTVNVTDNVAPVITLSGATTVSVNVGGTYNEPGYSATDNVDGNLTGSVVVGGGPVVTNAVATFNLTYNVSDAAGNAAIQRTRTVNVVDNNPPVITLNGAAIINLNVGQAYTEQGATATDPEQGSVPVTIGGDTVNVNVPGTYTVTYNASDAAGNNAAQVTRTVNVSDNNPPVITLNGAAVINLNVGQTYNEPGATATDPEEGPVAVSIGGDVVNTSVPGAYTVTYNASDSAGNNALQVTRTVNVADNNAPVITLNGPASITINVGGSFTDPGATATDNVDGNLTGSIVVGGDVVNPAIAGTYVITYNVSDSAGNAAAQVTRTVIVNALPVITITGDNPTTVIEGSTYTDAGATANDAEDGNLTAQINTTNTVNTDTPGNYTVTYQVTDSNGASATAVRNVTVDANLPPVISAQVALTTAEETPLALLLANFTVTDSDSLPASLTLTVRDGANYTRTNNTITPALDFNGDLTVPVTVSDGISDSAVFNAIVSVTAVNDRPQISGQQPLNTDEDTPLTVLLTDLIINDPDSVNFTLALLPGANYTVAGSVVTPAENYSGNLNVGATITDDSGEPNATSATVGLVIVVDAVNDFPLIVTEIADQNSVEGSPFTLNVSGNFSDADGDTLTYSINPNDLPASGNIKFNGTTGVFSGTPTIADTRDNAPYVINVTATDGKPGTVPAVDQFNLVISALDRANVSLAISVTPDPAMLNDQLRWTFLVRNAPGQQSAASVELNGSFIGSGLNVTSTSACTIQAPAGQVTSFNCLVGSLPPGGSTSVVITTATTVVGDVTAFAVAAGSQPVPIDPNLTDNSSQLAVGVAEVFSNGAVQILGNTNVRSIAAGDVDGDGSADLVVGTAAGQPVQIYLSGGFRDFARVPLTLADTNSNEGVALADFDRNGTLDIVVANGGGQADMVYSNDGAGNFTPMVTLGNTFAQGVAVGDFNDDGNPDIAFAAVGPNPVYLGSGAGGFTLHRSLGNANSMDVAVGRFDNNTRDDLVFANVGSPSNVWTKNSAAGFTSTDLITIGDAASVTVGEFGGNARDDLAFGRIPAGIGDVPANAVLVNNGSADFGNPVALLGAAPTFGIHAGDVDSDGLTDLVFINSSGVHQIWLSNGSGFDLYREQIVDRSSFAGVLTELGFTDVADPGGVDLAMGGAVQGGVGIFLNDGFGNLGMGDAVAPVLTLLGGATVDVPSGSAYVDSGAAALDNIDGDISGRISVSNPVNTTIVGAYTVTYNVQDLAGNQATPISRTVNVTPSAGTGGGGGGSISYWLLVFMLSTLVIARQRQQRARRVCRRARISNLRKLQ